MEDIKPIKAYIYYILVETRRERSFCFEKKEKLLKFIKKNGALKILFLANECF